MANLIVNLNNYNDSKCEIIVNGIDIFKNQKRITPSKCLSVTISRTPAINAPVDRNIQTASYN